MQKRVPLNLEDLRVESFETLPELTDAQAAAAAGGAFTATIVGDGGGACYPLCGTGYETVVCCYPTEGNGSAVE